MMEKKPNFEAGLTKRYPDSAGPRSLKSRDKGGLLIAPVITVYVEYEPALVKVAIVVFNEIVEDMLGRRPSALGRDNPNLNSRKTEEVEVLRRGVFVLTCNQESSSVLGESGAPCDPPLLVPVRTHWALGSCSNNRSVPPRKGMAPNRP